MFPCAISCYRTVGTVILLGVTVAAAPALAQMQQTAPPVPGAAPAAPPTEQRPIERTTMGMLEGAAKNVDPGAGTLQVSRGPSGIFRTTLEVTDNTLIQVEGRHATLSDIREGETVRASYETRDTKNVATRIEVILTGQGRNSGVSP